MNPDGNKAAIQQSGRLDVVPFGASTSVNAYIFSNSSDSADPQLA